MKDAKRKGKGTKRGRGVIVLCVLVLVFVVTASAAEVIDITRSRLQSTGDVYYIRNTTDDIRVTYTIGNLFGTTYARFYVKANTTTIYTGRSVEVYLHATDSNGVLHTASYKDSSMNNYEKTVTLTGYRYGSVGDYGKAGVGAEYVNIRLTD